MTWHPIPGQLMTRWSEKVTPGCVWPEYPRPQMVREAWLNLNGLWQYGVTPRDQEYCTDFNGEILVPFPVESALSGVKRALLPEERIYYRRTFPLPHSWLGKHVLLHCGAIDWEAGIWVNGKYVGKHQGGYLPFWFDITSFLVAGGNELLISAWDPTDHFWQQRGKQALKPRSIWYTAVSGIWQTVWLEPVPETYISGFRVTSDIDAGSVKVQIDISGCDDSVDNLAVEVRSAGKLIAQASSRTGEPEFSLSLPDARLWSPDSPFLYDLQIQAGSDRVQGYFAMRKFSVEAGRLCLNHRPCFQFGPLDQGYWPDGLYTPPSDAAMLGDLELIKRLGFNMLRKHVKVEPARYYAYCDRLGLIVWQDMPNGGAIVGEFPTFLALAAGSRRRDSNYRYAGRTKSESRANYMRELKEMVDHLYNFPCIGMWVPFNEGWGQFDANQVSAWLAKYDPTRPVDQASGFYDQGGGDCTSLHVYFKKLPVMRPGTERAAVLSEFGGYSMKVDGHLWDPAAMFGYKKYSSRLALTDGYLRLLKEELEPRIREGLSAAIYTQTTDVEIELNGYVTYDRAVEKMDFERIRAAHHQLLGS